MAKFADISLNSELNKKSNQFLDKLNSQMHYESELFGGDTKFEWVAEIEFACPYIDNIIRRPRVALIKEEDIVILEKAKKTSVATVKHLARNTKNIDEIDEETGEVKPAKLLIERNEETFNIYENRFIYTLIENLLRFVLHQEELLDKMQLKDDKVLEYAATTVAGREKINVELKVTANDLAKDSLEKLREEIEMVRKKIERMKLFIASWRKSEVMTALAKANVPLVIPPIKKTNLILKNPNFQVANRLWDFLQAMADEENNKDDVNTDGNNYLKGIMDDAFLMNYYVLDAVAASRKVQKEKLAEYAVVMIHQQLKRIISLLLDSGIQVTDQEILDMILALLKKERTKKVIDVNDIREIFRAEIEEYLNKTQNYF